MNASDDLTLKAETMDGALGPRPDGTVVGAAAGLLITTSVADAVNPIVEELYWRASYSTRTYFERHRPFSDYAPAYQYGWESRARMGDRPFGDVENDLGRGWEDARGASTLAWTQARQATSDAWHRIARG